VLRQGATHGQAGEKYDTAASFIRETILLHGGDFTILPGPPHHDSHTASHAQHG
jgi:hypothetical protein